MLLMQAVPMVAMGVQGISDLLLPSQERRCAAVILRLAGSRNSGEEPNDIHCTHEELATMCNLSRPYLSTLLKRFEAQGLIGLAYRRITILLPDRLRFIVNDG